MRIGDTFICPKCENHEVVIKDVENIWRTIKQMGGEPKQVLDAIIVSGECEKCGSIKKRMDISR